MRKLSLIIGLIIISSSAIADTSCGPFNINWKNSDGFARINGQRPESQKVSFFKAKDNYDNVKIQWMTPGNGRWLGMDFVARDGKPILNVEVIRKNMDEPRQFWTYDCKKVN